MATFFTIKDKVSATRPLSMATVLHRYHPANKWGVRIEVYECNNTNSAPHAHYFNRNGYVGRFRLSVEEDNPLKEYTSILPKSIDDIREMKGDNTTDEYKTRLFRYMTDKDEEGRFATNWERTVDMWNEENELWNIDFQG